MQERVKERPIQHDHNGLSCKAPIHLERLMTVSLTAFALSARAICSGAFYDEQ